MDPPPTVLQVIQALLYIIYPEQNFESWMECKQVIRSGRGRGQVQRSFHLLFAENHYYSCESIGDLRPIASEASSQVGPYQTADRYAMCHWSLLTRPLLADFPVMSLHEHGSLPAKYIYNWVLVCVALLEYSSISASITTIPPPSTHSIPPHPTPVPSDHTHQTPIPQ